VNWAGQSFIGPSQRQSWPVLTDARVCRRRSKSANFDPPSIFPGALSGMSMWGSYSYELFLGRAAIRTADREPSMTRCKVETLDYPGNGGERKPQYLTDGNESSQPFNLVLLADT
jgi:hypothetical protein